MSPQRLADSDQLMLDLDGDLPEPVHRARAHRRGSGVPQSLSAPDVVARLCAIFRAT